jgi:hypothetical protein
MSELPYISSFYALKTLQSSHMLESILPSPRLFSTARTTAISTDTFKSTFYSTHHHSNPSCRLPGSKGYSLATMSSFDMLREKILLLLRGRGDTH